MEHHPRSWIVAAALLAAGCAYGWTELDEDAADDGRVVDGSADAREGDAVTEVCSDGCGDGADDACDAAAGDACPCLPGATRSCYSGPAGTSGVGTCRPGTQACVETAPGVTYWSGCTGEQRPGAEDCGDGEDNDCDGTTDEGCTCATGTTQFCYSGPDGTAGVGACRQGIQTCIVVPDGGTAWGACLGEVLPSTERCDGADNDCDAGIDEGCLCTAGATESCYSGPSGTPGVGACRAGTRTCSETPGAGTAWGACIGEVLPVGELCSNGLDEDCDGIPDDGCGTTGPPNDTCATAVDMTVGGTYSGTTCGADNTIDLGCGTPGTPDVFYKADSGAGCSFIMTITPGFAVQFVPSMCSGNGGCGPYSDGTFSVGGGGGGWIWYFAVEVQAGGCGSFVINASGC